MSSDTIPSTCQTYPCPTCGSPASVTWDARCQHYLCHAPECSASFAPKPATPPTPQDRDAKFTEALHRTSERNADVFRRMADSDTPAGNNMDPATTQQQSPAPAATSVSVTDQLITDIHARREMGRVKYGVELVTHNGRDPLVDAYQEAIDLALYLRQAIGERREAVAPPTPQPAGGAGEQRLDDGGSWATPGEETNPLPRALRIAPAPDTGEVSVQSAGGAGEEWNPADGPPVEESLRSANYTIKTLIDANATLAARAEAAEWSLHYALNEGWNCQSSLQRTIVALCDMMGIPHHEHHRLASQLAAAREREERLCTTVEVLLNNDALRKSAIESRLAWYIIQTANGVAQHSRTALASTAPGVPAQPAKGEGEGEAQ